MKEICLPDHVYFGKYEGLSPKQYNHPEHIKLNKVITTIVRSIGLMYFN